jgi:pullulanase
MIRLSSDLFRLTTGHYIIDRVGFHNIRNRQQAGLIVMSLKNGIKPSFEAQLRDLNPMHDAILVMVNMGYREKTIEVRTVAGFQFHSMNMI